MRLNSACWAVVSGLFLVTGSFAGEPKTAVEFRNRGVDKKNEGKLDEAIADYTEAIRLDPKYAGAFEDRASAYWQKQKHDEAIADYTEVIRLNPKDASAWRTRGFYYSLLKKFDEAIADYTEAIRLDPKYALSFSQRGHVYREKGKLDESIGDYNEVIRLDPKDAFAFYFRGYANNKLGKYALAIADYQEALRLNPKSETTLDNLKVAIKKLRETGKQPEVISVTLDDELKSVVTKKSPPYKLAANSEKVVEDTFRVKHEVTVTEGWKAEAEVRGTLRAWFVEVQTGVRTSIEKSTSRTYGVETERKRSVTIKGTGSEQGVRVVWVDLYRTGKAKVKVDGVTIELPFSFREDFDLITEEAKDEKEKK